PVLAGDPWEPGTWNGVQLDGHDFPAPWPMDPEVTMTRMTLEFSADGRAVAHLRGTARGEQMEEDDRASYRVDGDRLSLLDEDGSVDEDFVWTRRGSTLRLVDVRGHVYEFERP
ncbi:hypothetical protein, partial [Longimicrobium sp.]|uniref:hypothetical protein n=1 Tax=Longimicrobium sp. TaxID=2029185 RepID=UPI002E339ED1